MVNFCGSWMWHLSVLLITHTPTNLAKVMCSPHSLQGLCVPALSLLDDLNFPSHLKGHRTRTL